MNESKNCSCNCGCHPVDSGPNNQHNNTNDNNINSNDYISTPDNVKFQIVDDGDTTNKKEP